MSKYGMGETGGSLVATTSPAQEESRELGDYVEQKKEPLSAVGVPTKRKTKTIWGLVVDKGRIYKPSLEDYGFKELKEDMPGLSLLLTNNHSISLGADTMANTLIEEGHLPHTDGDHIQLMLDALREKSKSLLLYDYDEEIEKEGEDNLKQWGSDVSVTQEDPTKKFLETLKSLIDEKRVYLDSKNQTGDILGGTEGDFIGYHDDDYLYLIPIPVWYTVTNYCLVEGNRFFISRPTLYRLLEKKRIVLTGTERSTVRLRVGKKLIWVLKLDRTTLENL